MDNGLEGKCVVVTGGGSGLGAALCHALAGAGAAVVAADVREDAADRIATSVRGAGGQCVAMRLDVGDAAAGAAALEQVVAQFGRLDVLINNAGTDVTLPVEELQVSDWHRVLATNLTGPFLMSRAALPHLLARRGAIVNIASALALVGWPSECAYGPSKAGVVQLTKGMALDYAGRIRVNCVCPGAVRTPMIESVLPPGTDVEAMMAEYGKIHPLHRRLADPREIADAVLFLASDDASLMTGAVLTVDAGLTAG